MLLHVIDSYITRPQNCFHCKPIPMRNPPVSSLPIMQETYVKCAVCVAHLNNNTHLAVPVETDSYALR